MPLHHTPPPPADGVERSAFSSSDEEEITDFIRLTYAENSCRFAPAGDGARFSALTHDVPALGSDRVRTSIDYTGTSEEGFEGYTFFLVHSGVVRVSSPSHTVVAGPGDAAFYPIRTPVAFSMHHFDVTTVRIPAERVGRAVEAAVGRPVPVRFHDLAPVSPVALRYWRSLTSLTAGSLGDPGSLVASPLIAGAMADTVAAAALQVFPSSVMTEPQPPEPSSAAPAVVRRAVAHLEAHAHEPLQLSDLAAAAGTSARTLQTGFRQHLGTTPMGYLRRVRLDLARRELQEAGPMAAGGTAEAGGTRTTVTSVAARWGFSNAGRFASAYRAAYGEAPSTTLRR